MIAVYPMLTTSDVQSHVLTGVCKVLERFVILYDMDAIAKRFNLGKALVIGGQAAAAGAKLSGAMLRAKRESYRLTKEQQQLPFDGTKANAKPMEDDDDKVDTKIDFGKSVKTMDVTFPKNEALSVEPTWVMLSTPTGTKILGIKVIPYPIESSEELGRMLMTDLSLKKLDTFMYGTHRKLVKILYALARGVLKKIPLAPSVDNTISGDPEKDILFASTKYKHNVFCLLNSQDLEKDIAFRNAGGISKLFKLGWNSIIINDDVNKKTNFCMTQFGGLCSSVSHSYLFASFGKENAKVYEKMEDIQKVTSPFFKNKIKPAKLFGESISSEKLLKYSDYSECPACLGD